MKNRMSLARLGRSNTLRSVAGTILLVLLASAAPAEEKKKEQKLIPWRDGVWRTEFSSFSVFRSGRHSRTGDVNLSAAVEYEIPLSNRVTNGLRFYPLFLYEENLRDRSIWGVAAGHTVRVYKKDHDHRGLFWEGGGSVLWHSNLFRGNSSRINFIVETGVGHKFDTNWHVSGKIRHISNAGIDSSNSGINSIGIGLGYTF